MERILHLPALPPLLAAWSQAVRGGDVHALDDLYTPDATVACIHVCLEGIDEIQAAAAPYLRKLQDAAIQVTPGECSKNRLQFSTALDASWGHVVLRHVCLVDGARIMDHTIFLASLRPRLGV